MNQSNLVEELQKLVNSEKRSESARLREVFDEVEKTLSAGVSRNSVLEALHKQGFTMTAKSFESAIYRLRKQRQINDKKKT